MLSAVVPCYNEAENIRCFLAEFTKVAKTMRADHPCHHLEFELIFVDDGSSDDALMLIPVTAGSNNIELRFVSPGLAVGCGMTLATALIGTVACLSGGDAIACKFSGLPLSWKRASATAAGDVSAVGLCGTSL